MLVPASRNDPVPTLIKLPVPLITLETVVSVASPIVSEVPRICTNVPAPADSESNVTAAPVVMVIVFVPRT